jgi:hypothetical protein
MIIDSRRLTLEPALTPPKLGEWFPPAPPYSEFHASLTSTFSRLVCWRNELMRNIPIYASRILLQVSVLARRRTRCGVGVCWRQEVTTLSASSL